MATKNSKADIRDVAKPVKVRAVAKASVVESAVAVQEVRDVAKVEVTGALHALAQRLGIDLTMDEPPSAHIDRAALNLSRSATYMLAAGVDLIAARAQVQHGAFLTLIAERGFTKDAAYRAISFAQFLASRPLDQQERLLALPKYKVLELAKAEPEVLDVLMDEDGPLDLGATNVRELAAQVRDLNKALTDIAVQRDAAASERDAALNRLTKSNSKRTDQVPVVIADLRAEIAVTLHSARAAVESMYPIGAELANLGGTKEAHGWIDPTAEIAFSGLVALHLAVSAEMKRFAEAFQVSTVDTELLSDPAFGFTELEMTEVARKFDVATRKAEYERALREWEREQARPRMKGRPAAKPVPPEGVDL